ncbi:hypothetical protein [Streptomyces sp. NPDC021608]|uniref:hypothetical protein n=1 Tax=Streptomyces sp. NPDC021608 TaxID=3154903 RepID=UPI0033CE00CD
MPEDDEGPGVVAPRGPADRFGGTSTGEAWAGTVAKACPGDGPSVPVGGDVGAGQRAEDAAAEGGGSAEEGGGEGICGR